MHYWKNMLVFLSKYHNLNFLQSLDRRRSRGLGRVFLDVLVDLFTGVYIYQYTKWLARFKAYQFQTQKSCIFHYILIKTFADLLLNFKWELCSVPTVPTLYVAFKSYSAMLPCPGGFQPYKLSISCKYLYIYNIYIYMC